MPFFTLIIVLVPLATSVSGANRYAVTSLLGIWPLLLPDRWQGSDRFRRVEKTIWVVSGGVSLFLSFVLVSLLNHTLGIFYWP